MSEKNEDHNQDYEETIFTPIESEYEDVVQGHTTFTNKLTFVSKCSTCSWETQNENYQDARRASRLHQFDVDLELHKKMGIDVDKAREEIMNETFEDLY